MNLYNDIKDLDSLIAELTNEIKYSKDKNKAVKRINKLVVARNNYFNTLSSNFYFDSLDTLILSNVLWQLRADGIMIPTHEIIERSFKKVFYDLQAGRDFKYAELEATIINGIDVRNVDASDEKRIEEKPKDKIQKVIMDMLDILKTDMVWSLKK